MSQTDPPPEDTSDGTPTGERIPAPPVHPRRVTKRKDDEVIDGVCSGIGAYLGIDPVLVRLGFVAAVFAGGAGIIAYIVCMVVIPEDPGAGATPPRTRTSDRSPQFWVGIGLIVLAVALMAARFDLFDGGIFWPLVLIGVGVALWRTSDRNGSTPPPGPRDAVPAQGPSDAAPAPGQPDPEPADPSGHLIAPSTVQATAPSAALTASTPPSSPRTAAPRERSPVGRITVAVALVTAGALVAFDSAGALTISVPELLAVVLVIVGGGLLVAARWGRARGLIPVGIVLVLVLVASGFATRLDVPLAAGVGERVERPGSVAVLEDAYELSIGHLVVDLTAVDPDGDTVTTGVHLGIGQVEVLVPDDVDVIVDARAGAGQLELFGTRYVGGTFVDRRVVDAGDGDGTLELDLSTGLGQIVVERRGDAGISRGADPQATTDRMTAADRQARVTTQEGQR